MIERIKEISQSIGAQVKQILLIITSEIILILILIILILITQ